MIRWVIENLKPKTPHQFIFIGQKSHIDAFDLSPKLRAWAPGCHVIGLDAMTQGAACTALEASRFIDDAHPLMIANCDQYVDADIDDYLGQLQLRQLSGLLMTMKAFDPKWSFVTLDAQNLVTRVVEKKRVSDIATVGIYNFARGCDFVRAAKQMIAKNLRVNNEFYVAPVYNELIEEGARIGIYDIGQEFMGMYGLGTPKDFQQFADHEFSKLKSAAL